MKSIHDFIVYTDIVFNETFKTESGLALFGDKRFLQKRLVQREVEIKAMPLNYDGEDIVGHQALVDATIFFQNDYDHGKGANNEIIGHKGFFKVQANMILAIRKDENSEWKGFNENVIISKVMDSGEEKKSGLIITEISKPKALKGVAIVEIPNDDLLRDEVSKGDTIRYNDYYGVDVYINSKEYTWIRSKDCLAKVL